MSREFVIVEDCGKSHLFYHSNHKGLPAFTNKKEAAYRFSSKILARSVKSTIQNEEDFVIKQYNNVREYGTNGEKAT